MNEVTVEQIKKLNHSRQKVINALIKNDLSKATTDNPEHLNTMLRYGWSGYYNFTDEELIAEVRKRLEAKEPIVLTYEL